jgi:hypothetical protein
MFQIQVGSASLSAVFAFAIAISVYIDSGETGDYEFFYADITNKTLKVS